MTPVDSGGDSGSVHQAALARFTVSPMSYTEVDVTERLFAEFAGVHALPTITAAVRQAHLDLQGAPPGAMPELVERLARQRLAPPGPSSEVTGDRG